MRGVLLMYSVPEFYLCCRRSLVLSMLQQMLDDRSDEVREAVVRSLGALVGWVDDVDKYPPTAALLAASLADPAEPVVRAVLDVMLPSVAVWAAELVRLESFAQSFIDAVYKAAGIEGALRGDPARSAGFDAAFRDAGKGGGGVVEGGVVKEGVVVRPGGADGGKDSMVAGAGATVADVKRFTLHSQALQQTMPFLFGAVLSTGPFANKEEGEGAVVGGKDAADEKGVGGVVADRRGLIPEAASDLLDVRVILGDPERAAILVSRFERYFKTSPYIIIIMYYCYYL